MELLGAVMLAMAGYSAGNALRGRKVAPALGDLVAVTALAAGAMVARGHLGRGAVLGVAACAGVLAGAVAGVLRAGTAAGPGEGGAWKRFALRMGNFQGRMLMGLFYFIILTPFALLSRMGAGAHRARREPGSFWLPRAEAPTGIERARNQF